MSTRKAAIEYDRGRKTFWGERKRTARGLKPSPVTQNLYWH